jgi:hypothetical protein
MPGTLVSSRQAELDLTNTRIALSRAAICARKLPPSNEHRPDNLRDIGTVEQQSLNLPIEGQSAHRPWQKAECLDYSSDMMDNRGVTLISCILAPRRARAR